jgi:hypothetical protein
MITSSIADAAPVAAAAQAASEAGLSFHDILVNIPHDASAFVVYVLMIGSVLLVLRAGRSHGSEPPTG